VRANPGASPGATRGRAPHAAGQANPGRIRVARGCTWATTAALGVVLAAVLSGCPSQSSSLPYTPYTGINFISQSIVSGVGCGTSGDQVFKYVVVIGDPSDAGAPNLSPLADGGAGFYASLVDCYTNGVFSSGATSPDGGPIVQAWIYAYDFADFQALAGGDAAATLAVVPGFASCVEATCPLSLSDVQTILRTTSTYTTTCTATPESGDNVLASCLPLVPSPVADAASDGSAGAEASISVTGDGNTGDDAAPGE